jgi:prevent-host-death family protein
MRVVNVAVLKNKLSAYLERVREGEEVLVKDRERPVARIVPIVRDEDVPAEELQMAAEGLVRLPKASLPASFWRMPAPRISRKDVTRAVRADRDED